jgi:hypothetical protein
MARKRTTSPDPELDFSWEEAAFTERDVDFGDDDPPPKAKKPAGEDEDTVAEPRTRSRRPAAGTTGSRGTVRRRRPEAEDSEAVDSTPAASPAADRVSAEDDERPARRPTTRGRSRRPVADSADFVDAVETPVTREPVSRESVSREPVSRDSVSRDSGAREEESDRPRGRRPRVERDEVAVAVPWPIRRTLSTRWKHRSLASRFHASQRYVIPFHAIRVLAKRSRTVRVVGDHEWSATRSHRLRRHAVGLGPASRAPMCRAPVCRGLRKTATAILGRVWTTGLRRAVPRVVAVKHG